MIVHSSKSGVGLTDGLSAAVLLLGAVLAGDAIAQSPRPPQSLSMVANMRDARPDDAAWPLSSAQKKMVSINFLEKLSAPSLNCVYGKPGGGGGYRVSFWADARPDLSRFSGIFPVNVDIAMSACPATWGEAVTVGWGAGAWDAAAGQAVADARERNAYGAEVERRMKETPESRRAAFIAAAQSKPRSSDDEDFALAQSIDREIAAMEAGIDGLHSRPFNDKLVNPGGLFDRINHLAQSAYTKAQSLKPGPAGRAAFDAWDERIGGPVMSGVARLEKIVYYRQNRRVRLNEVTADAGAQEMASWGNVDFNPVWTGRALLLEVFTRHLEGQPLIDPTFQRRIAKDLERLRPSGDPGRAYYYHVPAEPRPAWMMTPDEEESQGGKIVANLFAAAVGVGDLIRLIDKVDADIRESRAAFWQCYRVRCQQPGQAFYAYSYAMWAKDNFYFAKPAASAAIVNRGMSFLGEGAIDGGPVPMCAPQANALSGALASAAAQNANDPVGSARRIVAVMKGPVYAGWQACRDRMEYIHRPRF